MHGTGARQNLDARSVLGVAQLPGGFADFGPCVLPHRPPPRFFSFCDPEGRRSRRHPPLHSPGVVSISICSQHLEQPTCVWAQLSTWPEDADFATNWPDNSAGGWGAVLAFCPQRRRVSTASQQGAPLPASRSAGAFCTSDEPLSRPSSAGLLPPSAG